MQFLLFASLSVLAYCIVQIVLTKSAKDKLEIRQRLKDISKQYNPGLGNKNKRKKGKASLAFSKIKISDNLKKDIELSKIKLSPEEFLMMWMFFVLVPGALFFTVSLSLLRTILVMGILAFVPPFYLKRKVKKQQSMFEVQLGGAVLIMSNGLRAGLSFVQALKSVAENMDDPLRTEFLNAVKEIQISSDTQEPLENIAERMNSRDLKLLLTAVGIQQKVGGNLSQILDTISTTIHDRLKIKRSVKTITSQGRISGKVIGALPIFLLVVLSIVSPNYTTPLFESTLGKIMLAIGAGMEITGFLVINKIVNIKF